MLVATAYSSGDLIEYAYEISSSGLGLTTAAEEDEAEDTSC